MSKPLETLETELLANISGGGTSSSSVQIGVQATPPKIGPINVGVSGSQSATDYKTCVDAVRSMPGARPTDIAATCGMPPAN
jgi:hypothetical protein